MIQKTIWRPDTCSCVIEYEWDDAVPAEQRTHTISNIIGKCKHHNTTTSHEEHYDKVLNENRRKNIVLEEIKKTIPSATEIDAKGEVKLKEDVKWSYDDTRALNIEVPTLTKGEKSTLESTLNGKYSGEIIKVK